MPTAIRLVSMPEETSYAPLGVLGYCLSRQQFLEPVWSELCLPLKTVDHAPEAKLQDVVTGILAGCRAISQVNTRLRPDVALARAWDRERFADQSMLARTLDVFTPTHVEQLRRGSSLLFRQHSQVFQHDFADEWLWLDIDLTPLPSSKCAEASTKGKFAKKTVTDGSSPGCMHRSITKRSSRASTRASRIAGQPTSRFYRRLTTTWPSRPPKRPARFYALMLALAAMPT